MIKKEIGIGFALGIGTNLLGMTLYILMFSELPLWETIKEAAESDFIGTLITAGAILNFAPFYLFIRKGKTYRARGVLLATILAALVLAVLKLT